MGKAGRPRRDRWAALRAAIASAPAGQASAVRPARTWTQDAEARCDRKGRILGVVCNGCRRRWWSHLPCMTADCPRCADAIAERRARRCWFRMGAQELGVVVLTFPSEWRPFLTADALRELEAAALEAFQRWAVAELRAEVGGRAWWHPCGDACEKCGFGRRKGQHNRTMGKLGRCERCRAPAPYKPHLNIIFPGYGRDTRTGELRPLHLHLSPGQLWALREAWAAVLREAAALVEAHLPHSPAGRAKCGDCPNEPVCPAGGGMVARCMTRERVAAGEVALDEQGRAVRVNVFYEYRRREGQKRHALRYFARPFPAWRDTMPHQGRDFGLMAGQDKAGQDVRARYKRGIRPPPEDERATPCPCCGSDVEWTLPMKGADAVLWRSTCGEWQAAADAAAAALERD